MNTPTFLLSWTHVGAIDSFLAEMQTSCFVPTPIREQSDPPKQNVPSATATATLSLCRKNDVCQ